METETSVNFPIQTLAFQATSALVTDLGYPIYSHPFHQHKLDEAKRSRACGRNKLFKKADF